jgi:hypothetical protein
VIRHASPAITLKLSFARDMALRWTPPACSKPKRQFRKIIGYRHLATLVVAIERDHDRRRHAVDAAPTTTNEEAAIVLTA